MNREGLIQLISDISIADVDYNKAKWTRVTHEDNITTSIDWKAVNVEREDEGLPKISNEGQRKAYIRSLTEDCRKEEYQKLVEYDRLKRIYENREVLDYPL